jgi:hypothetical protein
MEIEIVLDQDGELAFLVFDGMTLLASFPTEDEALALCQQLDEEEDDRRRYYREAGRSEAVSGRMGRPLSIAHSR